MRPGTVASTSMAAVVGMTDCWLSFVLLFFPLRQDYQDRSRPSTVATEASRTILFTQTQHNSLIITPMHVLTSCFIMCSAYICFCWFPVVKKKEKNSISLMSALWYQSLISTQALFSSAPFNRSLQ